MGETTKSTKYAHLTDEEQEQEREGLENETHQWEETVNTQDEMEPIDDKDRKIELIGTLRQYFENQADWLQAVTFLEKAQAKIGDDAYMNLQEYENLEEMLKFAN